MTKLLNAFHLKIIAIITMTIDHVGYILNLSELYRIVGRISFPLFAFLLVESFKYTSSRKKLLLRLTLSAILIHLGLLVASTILQGVPILVNIFFTLSAGLTAIYLIDNFKKNPNLINGLSLSIILLLVWASNYFNFDYSDYGVIIIIGIYLLKNLINLAIFFVLLNAIYLHVIEHNYFDMFFIQWFMLLSLIFISCYNSKRGLYLNKYIFYLYYPLHLVIIYLVAAYIFA